MFDLRKPLVTLYLIRNRGGMDFSQREQNRRILGSFARGEKVREVHTKRRSDLD